MSVFFNYIKWNIILFLFKYLILHYVIFFIVSVDVE